MTQQRRAKNFAGSKSKFSLRCIALKTGLRCWESAAAPIRASGEIGKKIVVEGLELPLNNGKQDIVNVPVEAIVMWALSGYSYLFLSLPQCLHRDGIRIASHKIKFEHNDSANGKQ